MSLRGTARSDRTLSPLLSRSDTFQIVVPPLPSKAMKRQLPFRSDDGIFEEDFIEDRRSGLEGFVNKSVAHQSPFLLSLFVSG